jgi:hypothetical protein
MQTYRQREGPPLKTFALFDLEMESAGQAHNVANKADK